MRFPNAPHWQRVCLWAISRKEVASRCLYAGLWIAVLLTYWKEKVG